MLSTVTNTLQLEMSYRDYTERTYKIKYNRGTTAEDDQATVNQIKAFNTAASDSNSAVAKTFVSNNGATALAITSATLIEKTEDVIYSG